MTPEERTVLEYYAGFIPAPLRFKPEAERKCYHEWGWSPMESALSEASAIICEARGWLTPLRYTGPQFSPVRSTTAMGILALGQLS